MATLADIVNAHGAQYLERFGDRMLASHKRALLAIGQCRTAAMGGHLAECEECGHQHYSYHSCKNRNCPTCHSNDTRKWLEQREAETAATYAGRKETRERGQDCRHTGTETRAALSLLSSRDHGDNRHSAETSEKPAIQLASSHQQAVNQHGMPPAQHYSCVRS